MVFARPELHNERKTMNQVAAPRQLFGQVLLARSIITNDELRVALREQSSMHARQPLGSLLVKLGFISEADLASALSSQTGAAASDLKDFVADHEASRLVPESFAREHKLLPLAWTAPEQEMRIACTDTDNILARDRLLAMLPPGSRIEPVLAPRTAILQALDTLYGHPTDIDTVLDEIESGSTSPFRRTVSAEDASPVARLAESLICEAVRLGASDIHFEPEAGFLRIRYRIDGLLRQVRVLHKEHWNTLAVRLKVLAGLDIAESRLPQDGRISRTIQGRQIDFRAATQPTLHGENLVLRILDRQKGVVSLNGLGLDELQQGRLKRMIARPEGIILVTGPTGSGKTTTLYSILQHINTPDLNIMTLEDPIEYPMPLIRQTSITDAARLDFASGVRSILRQDPDVILIGEIRDHDTASMAFRAAMTGHQVYSTLHANSAFGTFSRLQDMGIHPQQLAGNLIGIVAQRLIRKLCPFCRESAGVTPGDHPDFVAKGCTHCAHTGYRGRIAIMEILRMDARLEELILRDASMREVHDYARSQGFRTLAEDGLARVRQGLTTLTELSRVVDIRDHLPDFSPQGAAVTC